MSTFTVPDLDDGPVVIRHGSAEPIELTVKGGKITTKTDAEAAAVRAAFASVEEPSTKTPAKEG
jgi:hypothetical protein